MTPEPATYDRDALLTCGFEHVRLCVLKRTKKYSTWELDLYYDYCVNSLFHAATHWKSEVGVPFKAFLNRLLKYGEQYVFRRSSAAKSATSRRLPGWPKDAMGEDEEYPDRYDPFAAVDARDWAAWCRRRVGKEWFAALSAWAEREPEKGPRTAEKKRLLRRRDRLSKKAMEVIRTAEGVRS